MLFLKLVLVLHVLFRRLVGHALKGRNEVVDVAVANSKGKRRYIVGSQFDKAHGLLNFMLGNEFFRPDFEVADAGALQRAAAHVKGARKTLYVDVLLEALLNHCHNSLTLCHFGRRGVLAPRA